VNNCSFWYSRALKKQQAIFSDFRTALHNNNVEVDSAEGGIYLYKRRKDDTRHKDDDSQPPSKKSKDRQEELRRSTECIQSTMLPSSADPHRTSTSSYTALSRGVESLQTSSHSFHRPFETAEAHTARTDGQCSPEVGSYGRPEGDVVSWSDCLRQLASALRRRRDDDDGRPAAQGDVGSTDEGRTAGDLRLLDSRRRDRDRCSTGSEHDIDNDSVDNSRPVDHNRHVSSSSSSSSGSGSSELSPSMSKFDTPSTECSRPVDDCRRLLSSPPNSAALQSQPRRPHQGLN